MAEKRPSEASLVGDDVSPEAHKKQKEDGKDEHPKFVIPKLFKNDRGNSLSYVVIFCSDIKRSVKFYQDLFGWKVRNGEGDEHWTELDAGHTAIALHKTEKKDWPVAPAQPVAGMVSASHFVPDAQEFHKKALEVGAKVLQEPKKQFWGGVQAAYAGPDGEYLSVVQADF